MRVPPPRQFHGRMRRVILRRITLDTLRQFMAAIARVEELHSFGDAEARHRAVRRRRETAA